jgi:phytanoyl-CoA hydroxylase
MWGVPGSHLRDVPVTYVMRQKLNEEGKREVFHDGVEPVFDISGAVPLEVKKGSIVILDGSFVHYSGHNYSERSRHAFTLHVVEGRNTKWEADNWLLRPDHFPFRLMNSVLP